MTEQQSGIPSQADHDEQHPPPSSETPLPRQPESPIQAFLRGIFFGPYELRAGWRLCIFILLLVFLFVILTVIGEILAPVSPAPQAELKISAVEVALGVLTFGSVLAAAATMSKLERRPMRAYGLPARGAFGGRFWLGMIWGFSALTVLLLVMHFLGGFNFGHPVLHGREILVYGVLWLLSFIATGFFEEYLVRGYPQFTLTTGMGFWRASLVLSVFFALGHAANPGESRVGVLQIVPVALFFCFTLRRTGSLWFAIGFHAAWDWGQSYFYGTPDSGLLVQGHLFESAVHGPEWITGGRVGPEASILMIPLIALLFVAFHLTHRQSKYPDPSTLIPAPRQSADRAPYANPPKLS